MADEAPIVIRLGAALDSTIEKSFATIEERAEKANQNILKANERASRQLAKNAEATVAAADKAASKEEAAAARLAASKEREANRAARAAERAAQQEATAAAKAANEREKASRRATAEALRGFDQIARAARAAELAESRAGNAANRRLGQRFAFSTANTATRFLAPYAPIASLARRTGADLARGLGVDLNPAGAIQRNIGREELATALSNSGFQELRHGQAPGPNNTRVASSTLLAESKAVALATGQDQTDILSMGRAFVGVTGNLDQLRKMWAEMGKISKATTSDATQLATATAKINAQMDETPTKAEDTLAVVRLLAGQGKLGAAEMKDYARSIGQIAGQAHRFHGDTSTNIAELSAMAQLSVQRGFSKSPLQAATGIGAFANIFSNAANVKTFAKFGISEAQLRNMDPEQIIKRALTVTGGDNVKMGTLFKNTRARAVTLPFEQAFNEATGGKKDSASVARGIDAVDAAFRRLTEGAMSAGEVDKEFAAQMNTTKSRVQQFQTRLDDVVGNVQAKLLPALDSLAPYVLQFAEILGKATTWVAENPKQAIAAGIGLSIGRAGIESALRAGIERLILGQTGSNAAAVGRVAGGLGAALAIGSLAVTTLTVGEAIIDFFSTKEQQQQRQAAEAVAGGDLANREIKRLAEGGDVKGAKTLADETADKQRAALEELGDPGHGFSNWLKKFAVGQILGSGEGVFGSRKALGLTDKEMDAAFAARDTAENQTRTQLLNEQRLTNRYLQQLVDLTKTDPGPGPGPSLPAGGRASQL